MPRKSKDELNLENTENGILVREATKKEKRASNTSKSANSVKEKDEKATVKSDPAKKSNSKSKTTKEAKSNNNKVVASNKVNSKKNISPNDTLTEQENKKTSTKSATSAKQGNKKATAKSATSAKQGNKNTTTKSSSSKKSATKKSTTTRKRTSKKDAQKQLDTIVEYYDLPYRYNETVVKILAQTPTMLFIYWDISDADKASYKNKYGEDFFSNTKPVLVVKNKTMNYTFEVDINDFANSWYLHVNDADCDYSVELGRRPIVYNTNIDNYVYVTTSNDMEMPNNRILFDKIGKSVFFKNVKNNFIEEKEIYSLSFIKNLGKVYDIYEFYQEIYKEEMNKELHSNSIKLNLSSSSSSTFK